MKRSTIFFIVSLVTLVLGAYSPNPSDAAEKARFGVNIKSNPYYALPALAAQEKGLWKNLGLEADYFPFDSGTTMQRAMAANALEMGLEGVGGIIQGITRGIPMIIVADPGILTQFYFWVRGDSPIKDPKGLKGARIGVTRFGSETHIYAQAVIKTLGLEKEARILSMGAVPPQVAAVRSGAIDATVLSNFTMASLKVRGEARELLNVYDYVPKGVGSYQVVVVLKEVVEKRPETAKKGAQGYLTGADYVMKNRDWAIEKMKTDFKYIDEVARLVYPTLRYTPGGKVDTVRIEKTREFLIQYGIVAKEKAPPLEELYTTKFFE